MLSNHAQAGWTKKVAKSRPSYLIRLFLLNLLHVFFSIDLAVGIMPNWLYKLNKDDDDDDDNDELMMMMIN